MKTFLFFLLLSETWTGTSAFIDTKFRTKNLKFFNDCRDMIATGSISRITGIIEKIGMKGFVSVGPASDMFRLQWSRELEQIAYEQSDSGAFEFGHRDKKGYGMFTWKGDIIDMIIALLDAIPLEKFIPGPVMKFIKDIIGTVLRLFETIILVIYLAYKYPAQFPVPRSTTLGPTHAFFGERTHIGCFNHVTHSVCVLKEVPADAERLFKIGIPCDDCPEDSRCEVFTLANGWYQEGNLCIPWRNEKPEPVRPPIEDEEDVGQMAIVHDGSKGSFSLVDDFLLCTFIIIFL
ncbi:unnamed protein product [Caenorhabditis sp. 36 PRJEB53466]|nr:unnamed protein product [Caenorhabditis sp. 36 PRJEB53466]